MQARIVAVCAKSTADGSMRKPLLEQVTLRAGWGVEGDLHAGRRPARQVLLMSRELLDDFAAEDMPVAPGDMGENLLTDGLDLMTAPAGTVLRLGDGARVQLTEERTPCVELEDIAEGLLRASLGRCGRFAAVIVGGHVRPGDPIALTQASPAAASSAS